MFPGGKIDPRKLQRLMREMGMEQEPVKGVERVEMHLEDGSKLVFERPQVVRMKVMGREFYQVAGKVKREEPEEKEEPFTEEDVKLVAEQAGVSEEEARKALEETDGDLAEAIVRLQGE